MKLILILFVSILLLSTASIQAGCIKGTPIWGTGDTKETCRYKQLQDAEAKQLELDTRDRELSRKRRNLDNGVSGNNNVIFGGGLFGNKTKNDVEENESGRIVLTKYQARVELMFGVKPDSAHFNTPGAPDSISINGAGIEYYVSPRMGFGLMMQNYKVTGARTFDPIRDTSGDVLFFPGDVESNSYSLIMPYVTFNGPITGEKWHWILRFGIGKNDVKREYEAIDRAAYPKVKSSETKEVSDGAAMLFDLGIEKWVSGAKLGCAARYITSSVDTSDYLEHMNMGSQQFLCYVQWMIRPFGLL